MATEGSTTPADRDGTEDEAAANNEAHHIHSREGGEDGGGEGGGGEGGGEGEKKKKGSSDGIHVAYTGEEVGSIPAHIVAQFSATARRLDLSYNKISSLVGLEKFQCLEELVLDNNQLTDSSLSLPLLLSLHTLTLNKNNIMDTDHLLSVLSKACPNLRYLSLLGNQACPNELLGSGHDDEDYRRYRYFVLHQLPGLSFLDSRPVSPAERREAKRVGAFMRVIRPPEEAFQEASIRERGGGGGRGGGEERGGEGGGGGRERGRGGYTPLPEATDVSGRHKGVFGQCKYVYYGKHSEGNRFIRNNEL